MRLFNKVAIIGVGLIGGSLALAVKRKKLAKEVIGVSRHKKTLLLAKRRRAIDKGSQDIKIIKDADLVILAMPVSAILRLSPVISKIIRADCTVFDVGSTKRQIVDRLDKIFPNYIGAHPLAGSEKRGIENSQADIFKSSICILTPTKNTDAKVIIKVRKLWSKIGAKVVTLPSSAHDKIVSFVSHLPHIVAFSLVNAVPGKYLRFSSTGFRDSTRIAASEPGLWRDIFLSNRKNVIKTIESYQDELSRIKGAIAAGNKKTLDMILKRAKLKRDGLNKYDYRDRRPCGSGQKHGC